MMRRSVALLCCASLLVLAACTSPLSPVNAPVGYARIGIPASQVGTQTTTPKDIPNNADKLRFRIWNPATQYNDVLTVALLPQGQTLTIEIPAGDNYVIDVVSYENIGHPVALTGDRATGVDIVADEVTEVVLALLPWDVSIAGPETVAPEAEYTLYVTPEDGGGLLTDNTFDTVTLRASVNDFSNPVTPLPPSVGQAIHSNPDGVALTGDAPDVAVETTLYVAALIQFLQDWFDYSLPNPAERSMFLELPNRHMAGALHELTIDPSTGGVVVEISSNH